MFRINNNLSALGAFHALGETTAAMNKSMLKLSKGLRIAEAADDPAGLVASEQFRAQLASIDAAIQGNQAAANFAKTAEGGLSEIGKLLNEARSLAVASGNTATLSAAQIAANQDQLNSIVASINRIAGTTSYGGRNLLDGSAGVTTQVSNGAKIEGISFSGTTTSGTVTTNGLITINQTVAATRALYTATATLSTGALQTGSFSVNGVTFNVNAGTSGTAIANMVNAASAQTGVSAAFNTTTNQLVFSQLQMGASKTISFSDANGVISSAANTNASTAGVNAVAQINFGTGNALFTGGAGGLDGLTLKDAFGNTVTLKEGGNVVGASAAGRVIASDATFQVGANAGQTASLSLRNMSAGQLGTGVAAGLSMNNLDLSTSAGAANAMRVIDKAIEEVSQQRGKIGSFQRYTVESNNRNLAAMKENVAASESAIRDLDVAGEMTKFTKLQVMQQAGMSMLGQANQNHQAVLRLLAG